MLNSHLERRRACAAVVLSIQGKQWRGVESPESQKEVVMRTLMAVAALVVGTAVLADEPAAKKADDKTAVIIVERIQDLHLTDEQEAKIAEVRKEFKPKVEEAAKELRGLIKDEVEKIHGVLTPEQVKKMEEFKEERRELRAERLSAQLAHMEDLELSDAEVAKIAEIRKEFQPKIEKAMQGLEGLLTDEQRKTREEGLKAGMRRREILASLKLTDDQRTKIEAVGKEVRTLVHQELEKVRDLLTESQQEKLREIKEEVREHVRDRRAHAIASFRELNLTDEQRTKIMEIRREFRPKIQEAGNKLRATVREELEAICTALKG
jgi:Spy/CpxP family protein refolding chaperone